MAYKTKKKKARRDRNAELLSNSLKLIGVGVALGVAGKMVGNMSNQ